MLASFAPEGALCADGDPVAADILAKSARHIADAARALCPTSGEVSGEVQVALAGGLFKMGDPLVVPLRAALTDRLPYARQVPGAGDPLAGAVRIAVGLAKDRLTLPREQDMLYVVAKASAPDALLPRTPAP